MHAWLRLLYDITIRERLPRKIGVYNTVAVRRPRLFDQTDVEHEYEQPLCDALKRSVRPSDVVVIAGGGYGVSSVIAARCASNGRVIAYEPVVTRCQMMRETAELNGVDERVTVKHAIVGTIGRVDGATTGAAAVAPNNLPECEVLAVDIEGAEMALLEQLDRTPRDLIVEYHGFLGVTRKDVERELQSRGYECTFMGLERVEKAVGVLWGRR